MNKWFGKVGYVETVEVEPGIWEEQESVRSYYGEFVRNSSKFQVSGNVNDDKDVSVELSIVADPYSDLHFHSHFELLWAISPDHLRQQQQAPQERLRNKPQ